MIDLVNVNVVEIIGLVFVLVLVVAVAIPIASDLVSPARTLGTITNEKWTGTAGLAHTTTETPIISVSSMNKEEADSQYNDTTLVGASGDVGVPLNTPYAPETFTITVNSVLDPTENVSVSMGGCYIGQLS